MLSQRTKNFILAVLSYDELNIQDYVFDLLGLKSHWVHDKHGSHFYGVILDERNGILIIVNRGTDGFDWIGALQSWWRNARLITGFDGVHNGFQDAGNTVIDKLVKKYIYNFSSVEITGHSQGTGPSQYELCLIAENFPHVKHSHADIFAYAPCGDERFKARFDKHKDLGLISCDGWMTEGDPLGTSIIRDEDSIFLDGEDVCTPHTLPVIIKHDLRLANVVKHSCAVYNAGMILQCLKEGKLIDADFLANSVHQRIIN